MAVTPRYLRVALATPLRRSFTYRPPRNTTTTDLLPGQRLWVPFGKRRSVGVLLESMTTADIPADKIKQAHAVIDAAPLFSDTHLQLLRWASDYYQYPIGEVVFTALPADLRRGKPARAAVRQGWVATADRPVDAVEQLAKRAPRQADLLQQLETAAPSALTAADFISAGIVHWRDPIRSLIRRGWVTAVTLTENPPPQAHEAPLTLNDEQARAVARITASLDGYQCHLLEGVTGSGKTEVYLHCVAAVLERHRQALVLLPEIALTPQLIQRFEQRFGNRIAVLHSGLSNSERTNAWLAARDGRASVVLGTRSAVWTPLRQPGVIIIDEEHDLSYKQHEGFRYHARDVAIMRAHRESIPIILGSATPSLESLHNADQGRYSHLQLQKRAGNAKAPALQIFDIRQSPLHGVLSQPFLELLERNFAAGRQALLFLNRRGYAPVLLCHDCGWTVACHRCDTAMTYHKNRRQLCCHHCGRETRRPPTCPECGGGLIEIGYGTERLVQLLQELLPTARIVRIDRDSTRRKGTLASLLDAARSGAADILVGTQMLAKGHHFPGVALVGILEADGGLFSTDFRALERMAQLIVQVSGRAGRAEHPGHVVIQTHHPDHPALRTLIEQDYDTFARAALAERQATELPPFSYLALLRAEAPLEKTVEDFLQAARDLLTDTAGIQILGPIAAPRPRRAGYQRRQLLLQSADRSRLRQALAGWLPEVEDLPAGKRVRWSIDVDPQETA